MSAHHRRGYFRADGKWVKPTHVSAHCRRNPKGYDIWHPRLKKGKPDPWYLQNEKQKKWTVEEIERVLETLGEMPEIIRNVPADGLYRMEKSEDKGNPATTNYGDTVLYDDAFTKDHNLAHVLAHEQAHRLWESLSDSEKLLFRKAGQWVAKRVKGVTFLSPGRPPSQYIERDGMKDPEEDFANGIEAYIFKPKKLKRVSPKVYEWIEKQFGDKLKTRSHK